MRVLIAILLAALVLLPSAQSEDRVRPITRIPPEYPAFAQEKEIAGRVRAALTVDANGKVTQVDITSESPAGFGFANAAKEAFAQWVYPRGVAGTYKAVFTFSVVPLELTPEEAALPFAAPPTSRARPTYPDKALDAGASAEVLVVGTIGASGKVESARVQQETPPGYGFGEAAARAMSEWRFAPGQRAIYTVTFRFRMEGEETGPREIAMPKDPPPAPKPSRAGTPVFPYQARTAGIAKGVVELGIQISNRGRISHAAILSETPAGYGFASKAYETLPEWRFNDSPPGTYKLTIEFLDD